MGLVCWNRVEKLDVQFDSDAVGVATGTIRTLGVKGIGDDHFNAGTQRRECTQNDQFLVRFVEGELKEEKVSRGCEHSTHRTCVGWALTIDTGSEG